MNGVCCYGNVAWSRGRDAVASRKGEWCLLLWQCGLEER